MTTPPPDTPAPPAAHANGARWAHLGTIIGAALAILASGYSAFESHQSGQAALDSRHAVTLTQEMLDRARERASKLEERITELEKWRIKEEAMDHVKER